MRVRSRCDCVEKCCSVTASMPSHPISWKIPTATLDGWNNGIRRILFGSKGWMKPLYWRKYTSKTSESTKEKDSGVSKPQNDGGIKWYQGNELEVMSEVAQSTVFRIWGWMKPTRFWRMKSAWKWHPIIGRWVRPLKTTPNTSSVSLVLLPSFSDFQPNWNEFWSARPCVSLFSTRKLQMPYTRILC